jgi:hypothetical protein
LRLDARALVALASCALIVGWLPPAAASAAVCGPDEQESVAPAEQEDGTVQAEEEIAEEPAIRWEPYGYIKLDTSVDSAAVEPGNFARWVASPELDHRHTHFNMTARQTRLGLWVIGREEESFRMRGRVEIDFYGGGGENKNGVQLRHAYIQVDWPTREMRLVAGQAADVISPLAPRTVNYTVAWWAGNIGYRRPLVSLTKSLAFSGNASRLVLTGGISRTIGDDFKPTEPGDAGTDSGLPALQVRGAFAWDLGSDSAEVGVSGHWGQEDVGALLGLEDHEFDSWSVNIDLSIPLGRSARLKAEAFTGQNLDDYFGGVGQGINVDTGREVRASGGWASIEFDPGDKLGLGFGFGVDDPDDSDLEAGARALNRSLWGTVLYDFTDYFAVGGEASWWTTRYVEAQEGRALRFQATAILSF